jgi:hypothetical protein
MYETDVSGTILVVVVGVVVLGILIISDLVWGRPWSRG